MTRKANTYNEDSIEHHKGLEGVRRKPGMYLGERGEQMVFRCLKEIVDNAADEYLAGRNNEIEVVADPKNNVYIVADGAQGIPVGIHKVAKIPTATLIFTELHAGGKFNSNSYAASAGTHGVGAAAVNAVSALFEFWTFREGAWYYQSFSKGKIKTQLKKGVRPPSDVVGKLQKAPKKGTIVRFSPDQTIVSSDGKQANLSLSGAASWLKNMAMMNTNLKITFSANGKVKTFLNTVGLKKLLDDRIASDELITLGKPLVFEDSVISLAVQWTSYQDDDGVKSFVSSSYTRDGGTHVDEFFDALTKSLSKYRSKKDKYTPRDLRNGLVGVLNYRMSQPEFSSQVKDRLTSNLKKDLFDRALAFLDSFFAKNKTTARAVIRRANDVKKTKEEFKKLMDGVTSVSRSSRGLMLPNILAQAKCSPDRRELFLVEGESAAGCHFSDVEVLLTDGSTKTFAQLVEDHEAGKTNSGFAFDIERGVSVPFDFVEPRIVKHVTEYIELTLEDGTIWRGTLGHPWLLSNGEYVSASDLKVGDDVQEARLPQGPISTSD